MMVVYRFCFATDSVVTGSYTSTASNNVTTKTWPTFLTTSRSPSTASSQRTSAFVTATIGQITASG